MDREQGFIEIGRIVRAHGLDGMVKAVFEDQVSDLIYSVNLCYLRNDRGDFYPARINECRPDPSTADLFFVQFENISDRTQAEGLKDHAVFLEAKDAPDILTENESEFEHLLDCEVFDENGDSVGLVTDVMINPAHPILVISSPEGSRLVPFVEHYVNGVENGIINCIHLDELEGI